MIKSLVKHGNSAALIIDRPILKLIGADIDAEFEITTDGKALTLTPIKPNQRAMTVRNSIDKIGKKYAKTFEELAK